MTLDNIDKWYKKYMSLGNFMNNINKYVIFIKLKIIREHYIISRNIVYNHVCGILSGKSGTLTIAF